MADEGKLAGRVAIVTGGARGIGAAISAALVARGAAVVVADNGAAIDGRDTDPTVARAFAAGLGPRAAAHAEDMPDPGPAAVRASARASPVIAEPADER